VGKLRYGVSKAEEYVAGVLDSLHLSYRRFRYICFKCGYEGRVTIERNKQEQILRIHHPTMCGQCCQKFGEYKYQYCEPDFIIDNGKNKAVIMVNGDIYHTESDYAKKDGVQIEKLRERGIKVYVIFTSDMEAFAEDLPAYLTEAVLSLSNEEKYLALCKKHNVGLATYSSFEFFMDARLAGLE
jgi:hypothetical protein